MSISLEPDLDHEVREAAKRRGLTLSAWIAEAAAQQLRHESLRSYLDDFEREFGPFTDEELAQARRDMGYDS